MKNIKIRLLVPTVLMSVVSLCAIAAVSYMQYLVFLGQVETAAGRHALQIKALASSKEAKNRELVSLLKNNWRFIDSVTLRDMNAILDMIIPYHADMHFGFVTVYDLQGTVIARADFPGSFGAPDGLTPLALSMGPGRSAITEAVRHEGRLALLTMEMLEGTAGPIGILAVGTYFDEKTIGPIAAAQNLQIILYLNGTEAVVTAVPARATGSEYEQRTDLDLDDGLTGTTSLKALIVDDVSAPLKKFRVNLAGIAGAMALISALLIALSRKTILAAVREIDSARLAAEENGEQLAVSNAALAGEIDKRTMVVEELRLYKSHLEKLVEKRTAELTALYELLQEDMAERERLEADREKAIRDLKEALSQVKMLAGLLPICSCCKKIRDDKGAWQKLEAYISTHSEATFTHGICAECAEKLYSEFFEKKIIP